MSEILDKMRHDAEEIFQAGLKAVKPEGAINHFCTLEGSILTIDGQPFNLDSFDEIMILGAGKGGASMAKAMETMLGDRITRGLVVVKYDHLEELHTVRILEASHPVPMKTDTVRPVKYTVLPKKPASGRWSSALFPAAGRP